MRGIGLRRLCLFAWVLVIAGLYATARSVCADSVDLITPIGCFANVHSDGEYADGYTTRMWFRGNAIIGLIEYDLDRLGDNPIGVLSDVDYDSSTGAISFRAKLSIGLHYDIEHLRVPSHDLLSFHGILKSDRLEGQITIEDQLDSTPFIVDTRENFVMRKEADCLIEGYENYNAWWQHWEPVNKLRGPKW